MEDERPRLSLVQIMVGNASLLSVLYLAAGAAIEALRRLHSTPGIERASLAMDSLPARALELAGAMGKLRELYVYGRLSELWLRIIFGATVVAIVFAMAFVLGALMWLVRWVLEWQAARAR